MTIPEVHLLMLGLAILVSPIVAGALWQRSPRRPSQWATGLLAGSIIALSPLIRYWENNELGVDLLTMSLLVSAFGLLVLLLLRFMRRRTPRALPLHQQTWPDNPGRDGAADNHPLPNTLITDENNTDIGLLAIEIDATGNHQKLIHADVPEPQTVIQELPDISDAVIIENSTDIISGEISDASPDITDAEIIADSSDTNDSEIEAAEIDEAEIANDNREFPETSDVAFIELSSDTEQQGNATLEEVLQIARQSATALNQQVTDLQFGMAELRELNSNLAVEQSKDQLAQVTLIRNRDTLVEAQADAFATAEALIDDQRQQLSKAREQRRKLDHALTIDRQNLDSERELVRRFREMARDATRLARRAALAQQDIKKVLQREQAARLKSEESARRAVKIAQKAIKALAEKERGGREIEF